MLGGVFLAKMEGLLAIFLEKGISKFFPLKKIEMDSPLFSCLRPIHKEEEEKALWGLETTPEFQIRNIHQWMNDRCNAPIYLKKKERPFFDVLRFISDNRFHYNTDLIILDRYSYMGFLTEVERWLNNPVDDNYIIDKIVDRTIRVDFSPYANKDEILLLNRNEFQILLGADRERQCFVWNLVMLDGTKNQKIVLVEENLHG